MKTRQLYILLVIFAVLGAGIALRSTQKPPQLVSEELTLLDLSIDPARVEKIKIQKGQDSAGVIELAKQNGIWELKALTAGRVSAEKAEELLMSLQKIKGEPRGRGQNIFPDFGIEDEKAFQLSFYPQSGPALLELYVGIKSAGDGFVFLRKKGSETVYRAESDLPVKFGAGEMLEESVLSPDFWVARNFMAFDRNSVRSIQITQFDQGRETVPADVSMSAGVWSFARQGLPFKPSEGKVLRFLEDLKNIQAEKALPADSQDYGFSKPSWRIKIKTETGSEKVFTAGGGFKQEGAVFFQSSEESAVFQVSETDFKSMDINDLNLISDNPLGVDPEAVEKLTVQNGKETFNLRPMEKKWENLTGYLKDLKDIQFTRILADSKGFKPSQHSIEITSKGKEPVTLEFGNLIDGKEYPVMITGGTVPLTITEQVYKWFFENQYRLKESETSEMKS